MVILMKDFLKFIHKMNNINPVTTAFKPWGGLKPLSRGVL